jgi:hypothetical protein
MIMPSYTSFPESSLSPSQIMEKFNSTTLAGLRGLGCGCSVIDDNGDCVDPEECGGGTTPVTALPLCSSLTFPAGYVGPINCDPSQGGPNYAPGASTQTGTGSTGTQSSGLTAQQIAAQNALTASLVAGGLSLSKILAAGNTGVTVLPNGALIPQGSNVGTLGLSSSGGFLTGSTGILIVAGIAAFALLGRR